MGMYSFFEDEDIIVLDYDNLKKVVKLLKENDYGYAKLLKLDDKTKSLSFESWNDIKLISYWYDECLLVLDLISPYIQGRVWFNFESKDEAGNITFENGNCILELGNMLWKDVNINELYRDEVNDLKLNKEIKQLRDNLKLVRTEKKI